jgi:hypothetical protein
MTFVNPFRSGPALDAVDQSMVAAAGSGSPLERLKAAAALRGQIAAGPAVVADEKAIEKARYEGEATPFLTVAEARANAQTWADHHETPAYIVTMEGSGMGFGSKMTEKGVTYYVARTDTFFRDSPKKVETVNPANWDGFYRSGKARDIDSSVHKSMLKLHTKDGDAADAAKSKSRLHGKAGLYGFWKTASGYRAGEIKADGKAKDSAGAKIIAMYRNGKRVGSVGEQVEGPDYLDELMARTGITEPSEEAETKGVDAHAMRADNGGTMKQEAALVSTEDQQSPFERKSELMSRAFKGVEVAYYKGYTNPKGRIPRQECSVRIYATKEGDFIGIITVANGGANGGLGQRPQRFDTEEQARSAALGMTNGYEKHEIIEARKPAPVEPAAAKTMTIADFPLTAKGLNDRQRTRFEESLKVLTDAAAAGQIMNMRLKEAKDFLSRVAGEAWTKNINDDFTFAGKWQSLPQDIRDNEPTPSNLHDYRFNARKLGRITSAHPMVDTMRALTAEMMPLVELVDELKGKVSKREVKTDEQKREAAVQKAIPKTPFAQVVWDAVMAKKPELEEYYKGLIRGRFADMVKALGSDWRNVVGVRLDTFRGQYTAAALEKIREIGVSGETIEHWKKIIQGSLGRYIAGDSIDEKRLEAGAKEYADNVTLSLVSKIQEKAGELENPKVSGRLQGFEFDLTGEFKGSKVRIEQTTTLVVNSYGTMFNQWPARIYVDGKFMPEAAYKTWMLAKA